MKRENISTFASNIALSLFIFQSLQNLAIVSILDERDRRCGERHPEKIGVEDAVVLRGRQGRDAADRHRVRPAELASPRWSQLVTARSRSVRRSVTDFAVEHSLFSILRNL